MTKCLDGALRVCPLRFPNGPYLSAIRSGAIRVGSLLLTFQVKRAGPGQVYKTEADPNSDADDSVGALRQAQGLEQAKRVETARGMSGEDASLLTARQRL